MKKRIYAFAVIAFFGFVFLDDTIRQSKMDSQAPEVLEPEVLENVERFTWSSRRECIRDNHKPMTLFGNEVQFPIEYTQNLCNCFFRFKSNGITEREMDICFEKFAEKYLDDL